jgi:methylenetetrahydrofolate reductase (NADPH)
MTEQYITDRDSRNSFRTAVKSGKFLITAEVTPPKGSDPTRMIEVALALRNWVHAVNVTDGSRAVLRMSPLAAATILSQHGIEPICQMTCRDRNQIAIQADLMGANALGINNILALTVDLEAVRLLQTITKLNQGFDYNGKGLCDGATQIFPGAAVDPQLASWSGLQRRFERKVAAGAQFFQSQMIVDFSRLEKFMSQIAAKFNKPILAGIFLLKSAKNAQFINQYVPGVNIPQAIIARLEQATDPLHEGIVIAAEQVRLARQVCQGVHIMAVKREDLIPQILEMAEISPQGQSVQNVATTRIALAEPLLRINSHNTNNFHTRL